MSENLTEAHKIIAEGWEALNQKTTKKQQQEQAAKQYEFAEAIAACFVGPGGKQGLMNLRKQFVDPPTWPPHATNYNDTTAYGFTREGQKSVIKFIENCLKAVEDGPPNIAQE